METIYRDAQLRVLRVLIVPCGMETGILDDKEMAARRINCTLRNGNRTKGAYSFVAPYVLIVPCGMETQLASFLFRSMAVFIVPCGMETRS